MGQCYPSNTETHNYDQFTHNLPTNKEPVQENLTTNTNESIKQIAYNVANPFTDTQFTISNSMGGQINQKYIWKRCTEIIGDTIKLYDKISPQDIKQGALGDCYLMCAFTGFAMHPEIVKELFKTTEILQGGRYEVKVHLNYRDAIIPVDDLIPCYADQNLPAFAKPVNNQIWVMLLEKVWAKINGSYSNIISGNPCYPVRVFLGAPSDCYHHKKKDEVKTLWDDIIYAMKSNQVAAASVGDTSPETGLVSDHFYAIIGTKEIKVGSKSVQLIKLRNPWGSTEWKGDWSHEDTVNWTDEAKSQTQYKRLNDGLFYMSFDDFLVNYSATEICRVRPNYVHTRLMIDLDVDGYSYIKIKFNQDFKGYIFLSYLDYHLIDSDVGKFKLFYVYLGIWKKISNTEYEKLGTQRLQAPNIILIDDKELSKGEYRVLIETSAKDKKINKLNIHTYGTAESIISKKCKISNNKLGKLMRACFNESKPIEYKEAPEITSYYLFQVGGVSFSAYLTINKSNSMTLHENVKLSNKALRCFPPYDQKEGEFEIEVPPQKENIVLFRPYGSSSMSISRIASIKLPPVDVKTLLNKSNLKDQYCSNGILLPIYKHLVKYNNEYYIVYLNKSRDKVLCIELTLQLRNLRTDEGVLKYTKDIKPDGELIVHISPIDNYKGSSYSSSDSYRIKNV